MADAIRHGAPFRYDFGTMSRSDALQIGTTPGVYTVWSQCDGGNRSLTGCSGTVTLA